MKYYLLIFTGIFILSSFLIGLIMEILNSIRSLGAVSALILAGFFTAWHFVNKEKRLPFNNERIQLIWGSIACTFIVLILFSILMNIETGTTKVFMDIAKQIPMWIWLIVIVLVTLIEFAVLYFSYGCFAQKCWNDLNKKHLR